MSGYGIGATRQPGLRPRVGATRQLDLRPSVGATRQLDLRPWVGVMRLCKLQYPKSRRVTTVLTVSSFETHRLLLPLLHMTVHAYFRQQTFSQMTRHAVPTQSAGSRRPRSRAAATRLRAPASPSLPRHPKQWRVRWSSELHQRPRHMAIAAPRCDRPRRGAVWQDCCPVPVRHAAARVGSSSAS